MSVLRLQELPPALPLGTPSGEGVYLTVYPSSRPNTDTVSNRYAIFISLKMRYKVSNHKLAFAANLEG